MGRDDLAIPLDILPELSVVLALAEMWFEIVAHRDYDRGTSKLPKRSLALTVNYLRQLGEIRR